ncbi:MAG: hypothetical protein A2298_05125 [Gammaproteobacteria bacterium RIFOXYB2_FULL_38_6]|nr:MAG: hypothetical protein A2298_05125 [Gammaproteobacteria bacterium RIFOXYB2_FULL_38_6]
MLICRHKKVFHSTRKKFYLSVVVMVFFIFLADLIFVRHVETHPYLSNSLLFFHALTFHIILLAFVLFVAIIFIENTTKPMRLLTEYINHFLSRKFQLSHEEKIRIGLLARRKDELALLAKAFLRLDALKDKYVKELTTKAIHTERFESELRIAKKIQLSLLPKKAGLLHHPCLSLYAYLEAAHQVGGDFYNFFFMDEKNLCFMIGDVSDKGIPAAIFMAVAKTLIEALATYLSSPADILTALNSRLCLHNEYSMFTTVFLGILNIETGDLKYVNAGNNPPILLRQSEAPIFLQNNTQTIVGVFEDLVYSDSILKLNSNDILLLYTDGVTEARNKEGEMFSEENLLKFMSNVDVNAMRILIRKLIMDIKLFTKDEPPFDDITLLALCYQQQLKTDDYYWKTLPVKIESIRLFLDFIQQIIPQKKLHSDRVNEIILAIEECLVNVIKHAFVNPNEHEMTVGCQYNAREQVLSVCIKDNAKPFNPLTIQNTKREKNEDHGYGFFLIEDLSDELHYHYQDGQNILDISFILRSPAQ